MDALSTRQEEKAGARTDFCLLLVVFGFMDKHGHGEVAIGEHRDNMRQVRPDGLYILGIFFVINGYFDGSAIRIETKMMGRLVMREAHRLVTMLFHIGLVLGSFRHVLFVHRSRMHVLCSQWQASE
jgi:hypothetical protein